MDDDIRQNYKPRHSHSSVTAQTLPKSQIEAAKLNKKIIAKSNRNYKKIVIVLVVVLLGVAIAFSILNSRKSQAPLPQAVTENLIFPIYYPLGNIGGYSYKSGSAKIINGTLYFSLKNGAKSINITEQAAPPQPINLKALPSSSNLDVPFGNAVIGVSVGNPSIVIQTPGTLIFMTSSKGVTKADMKDCALNMQIIKAGGAN